MGGKDLSSPPTVSVVVVLLFVVVGVVEGVKSLDPREDR